MKLSKLVAPVAAVALATGLTACADNADNSANTASTTSASASATSTEQTTVVETESEVVTAVADEDLVEATTAGGETVKIPAALQEEAALHDGLGELQNVETNDEAVYTAEYENGRYIVFSPEHGAYLVQGMIAQTWREAGGVDSQFGVPTENEHDATGAEGWYQVFAGGTISWVNQDGVWGSVTE